MFPSRKITSGLRSLYSFLTNGKQLMLPPLRFVARNKQKSEDLAGRTMAKKNAVREDSRSKRTLQCWLVVCLQASCGRRGPSLQFKG